MNDSQTKLVVANFKLIRRAVKCLRANLETPFQNKLDVINKMLDDIEYRCDLRRE